MELSSFGSWTARTTGSFDGFASASCLTNAGKKAAKLVAMRLASASQMRALPKASASNESSQAAANRRNFTHEK